MGSTPAIHQGLPRPAEYYPSRLPRRQAQNDRWQLCTGQKTARQWAGAFVSLTLPDLVLLAANTGPDRRHMTPRDIEGLKRKLRKLGVPAPCIRNHIERTLTAKAMREKRHAAFLAEKAAPFRPARPSYAPSRPRPPENCIVCGARIRKPGRRTCSEACLIASRRHALRQARSN